MSQLAPAGVLPAATQAVARRILVVEDEPELRRSLTLRLKAAGYDVYTAVNGQEAILVAQRIQPHLALLDLGLPGANGHSVARQWRSNGRSPFPVIVLTSREDVEDRALAGELGAAAYLTKPYEPEALLSAIRCVLAPDDRAEPA
ncbi:MAG: response regulator transcription factor [Vicinamibacterales bacterium]